MSTQEQVNQIDVDELAKEKVKEVTQLLESSENPKPSAINLWISVLKEIITAADLHRKNDKNDNITSDETSVNDSIYADFQDDNEHFNAVDLTEQFANNSVKWTIRVEAFKVVHRIVQMCSNTSKSSRNQILKHLPDLIRLSFVAATSPYDDLKIQGFRMFKYLINRFASVEETGFCGHSILEQYRTQVLTALKPAFDHDAPPYITAIASQICCLWICKGLEKDFANLQRTYQLMVTTVDKLEDQSINQNIKLYTESELEQERLDILGSWAQLFIATKESEDNLFSSESNKATNSLGIDSKRLEHLVKPQIKYLIFKWWEALKDYALIIMPATKTHIKSHDNDNVYTREVALQLFNPVWPKLLLASTIWLTTDFESDSPGEQSGEDHQSQSSESRNLKLSRISKTKYLNFLCGVVMNELCRCHSEITAQRNSLPEATVFALRSLYYIINDSELKHVWVDDLSVTQEFYSILYSILISGTTPRSQHHLILKNLLHLIFILIIKKIVLKPEQTRFVIALLINSIESDLVRLGSMDEEFKTNISIKISNVITIIKLATQLVISEELIRDAIIKIFDAIIYSEDTFSYGISLMSSLKDLYTTIPQEYTYVMINGLLKAKENAVSNLYKSIKVEASGADRSNVNLLAILELYLKSLRSDIGFLNEDHRKEYMKVYVKTLLAVNSVLDSPQSDLMRKSRQKELVLLILMHLEELSMSYPGDYETILSPDMKKVVDEMKSMQKKFKTEDDCKVQAPETLKSNEKVSIGPKKIVLKVDFSNFYAKKS